jgi:hypothetical protein
MNIDVNEVKVDEPIRYGIYEHFKGKPYELIGVARHSETLEEHVVYKALYGDGSLWVRPKKMFFQKVNVNGKEAPRFRYIKEK